MSSWSLHKIGNVLDVKRGGSPRPIKKYITDDPDGLNWIKIGDATASGKYIYKTKQKITKDGLHKTRLVEEGDFLLSNSMSFGRPYIMGTKGCIHDGWLVLRDKKEVQIDTDYLYHLLGSPYMFQQFDKLAAGSTVRNLNISLVSSVEIPIPPLPEQKRIVAILDEAFEAIDQAKANIEKNIQNAEGLFQSKLNVVFSQKGDGWEEKKLEEICIEVFAGGDAPKERFSKTKTEKFNIPIIANAVKDNGLYGYTDFARVTKPAITVAARGSGTGHTDYRDYPFFPIVRLIVLNPKTEIVDAEFLMFALKNITITRSGSAIPQLTVPMMKSYSFNIPSVEVQRLIVQELNELQSLIDEIEINMYSKIESIEELKKSILQKAFNGELTGGEPGLAGFEDEQDGLVSKAAEPEVVYKTGK